MADETELKIVVRVNAETKQLEIVQTGLADLEKTTTKLSKSTSNNNGLTKKSETALRSLSSALGVNVGAFTSVAGAAAALGKVMLDSIKNEQEEIARQLILKNTLNSLGLSYDGLKGSIEENLKSLRKNTKFTTDQTLDAFNRTLKTTGNVTQAYKLLKISMDIATATGKDQQQVLEVLNASLAAGSRGTIMLAREFGNVASHGKTAAEVIEIMGKAFNNARLNAGELSKQSTGLKETYDQMTQGIGKQLLPVLSGFIVIGKTLIMTVLTPLTYALAAIKSAVDVMINPIRVVVGFAVDGIRGAGNAFKITAQEIGNNFKEATDTTVSGWQSMFGAGKKATDDMKKLYEEMAGVQIHAIRSVEDEADKADKAAKKAAEEAAKAAEEAQKKIDAISGIMAQQMDTLFQDIAESGNISKETLDKAFTDIYHSFRDMLIKMVAELIAKQAVFGILSALSGGGFGFATSLLSAIGGGVKGAFDTGGTVPETGAYMLQKGERVSKGGPGVDTGGNSKPVVIQQNLNLFDIRQLDQVQINRLARQMTPHIVKEINRGTK